MHTRHDMAELREDRSLAERADGLRHIRPTGHSSQFVNTVNSFAQMVAPRRRVIRDPYYGAMPDHSTPRATASVKLTKLEWAMTVIAGIVLGTAVAFLFAGL